MAIIKQNIIDLFRVDTYLCSILGGYTLKTYMMNKHKWDESQWKEYHSIYFTEIGKNNP
jgi:hypothetical protein